MLEILTALAAVVAPVTAYDRNWWLSRTAEQRFFFFAGEEDCYIFDAKGKQYSEYLNSEAAERITTYLQNERGGPPGRNILSTFRAVFRDDRHLPDKGGGEFYPGKHGIFDGSYWNMASDVGVGAYYVMGYLACQRTYRGKVSKYSPDRLTRIIDRKMASNGDQLDSLKIGTLIDKTLVPISKR